MDGQLRYADESSGGIRRRGTKRFRYVDDATGEAVTDEEVLDRIRRLAIPPAWIDVWICPDPQGHLQATGRDVKGRKQYRYHPDFRLSRETAKFALLTEFGEALGSLRKQVDDTLGSGAGRPHRDRVLALMVALLDRTWIRVGNDGYARDNGSFGLTTLRDGHARIDDDALRLCFVGKAGKKIDLACDDRRIARAVRRCRDLPGQRLFQYVTDDGEQLAVKSNDVNAYLKEQTGLDVTAKSFRTWGASTFAAEVMALTEPPAAKSARAKALKGVMEEVAARLCNTPTVCRASYVHPTVVDLWEQGSLPELWAAGPSRPGYGLDVPERRLLHVLEEAQGKRRRQPRSA